MEDSYSESLSNSGSVQEAITIESLIDLTKNCKFFKNIIEEQQSSEIHRLCCEVMEMQEYSKDEIIIRYGDPANDFYVILKGYVGIYIPSVRRSTLISQSAKEFEQKLMRTKRSSIFRYSGADDGGFISKNTIFLTPVIDTSNLEKVLTMGPGESFGELALINNKPRAATVIATTDLSLAVLSKKNFKYLLSKLTEKRLDDKLRFFHAHPMFGNFSKTSLTKLSYYFSLQKYTKGQYLYRFGNQVEGLYFIKSGEFLVWYN